MEYRKLGATGINVSVFGFGCGAVGGLMVRGEPADRVRAVGRALDAGVNYFDTAALYGNGLSEQHLGQALRELHAAPYIGTKARLAEAELADIPAGIRRSLDASLQRLGRDNVTLLQLHNSIGARAQGGAGVSPQAFREQVLPTFDALVAEGKIRYHGITAVGDSGALRAAMEQGGFDTAQVPFNLLNPTAGHGVPPAAGDQDFSQILNIAPLAGIGTIAIRVLAGGALSGAAQRHAIASPPPAPIGTSADYAGDLARAARFQPLVDRGYAASLNEAATRFARSHRGVSTVLVGLSELAHLETALAAIDKGDLPPEAMALLRQLWAA
ncbi:MAG: aldo/keto reductase [Dehalococcoidia bacterium]|nr:aldo/keto reductase [Dehalococcoidia bacterium]